MDNPFKSASFDEVNWGSMYTANRKPIIQGISVILTNSLSIMWENYDFQMCLYLEDTKRHAQGTLNVI